MASADTTWRDALILDAPRIAGLRVHPLSAWHCHVAQMLDIRFGWCDDGNGPTPGDLSHALAVCRSQYRQDHIGVSVAGWALRLYLRIRWTFLDWRKDAREFCGYIDAYRRYPQIVRKGEKDGEPMGCPPFWASAVDVSAKLPFLALQETLNMPLIQLYTLRATLMELGGGPTCAWRTAEHPDEIKAALDMAQKAIDKHNAKKSQEAAHG